MSKLNSIISQMYPYYKFFVIFAFASQKPGGWFFSSLQPVVFASSLYSYLQISFQLSSPVSSPMAAPGLLCPDPPSSPALRMPLALELSAAPLTARALSLTFQALHNWEPILIISATPTLCYKLPALNVTPETCTVSYQTPWPCPPLYLGFRSVKSPSECHLFI